MRKWVVVVGTPLAAAAAVATGAGSLKIGCVVLGLATKSYASRADLELTL